MDMNHVASRILHLGKAINTVRFSVAALGSACRRGVNSYTVRIHVHEGGPIRV